MKLKQRETLAFNDCKGRDFGSRGSRPCGQCVMDLRDLSLFDAFGDYLQWAFSILPSSSLRSRILDLAISNRTEEVRFVYLSNWVGFVPFWMDSLEFNCRIEVPKLMQVAA